MRTQTEFDRKISEAIHKYRSEIGFHGVRDSRLLELIGEFCGQDKLDEILLDMKKMMSLTNGYSAIPQPFVYKFISELSRLINPSIHLDPYLTLQSPSNFLDFGKTIAYCKNKNEFELIKSVFSKTDDEVKLADWLSRSDDLKQTADLITCFPPFNSKMNIDILPEYKGYDLATILLIRSAKSLLPGGSQIFLMPLSFINNARTVSLMKDHGLHADAVFYLQPGALSNTAIASNLVLISKNKNVKTFVAEISSDENINNAIIENYVKRRPGKTVQLGCLQQADKIKSPDALAQNDEINKILTRTGYPKSLLGDLANKIALVSASDKDGIEHVANSIYFPKIGNSRVVTTPTDMKMKNPKNYFHIQLIEDKVNATFLANFFNSDVGKKIRESLEAGSVIPSINKSTLVECPVCIPDLKSQLKLVEIDNKIAEMSLSFEEVRRSLWNAPKNYPAIEVKLSNFQGEGALERWIDILPFPLSSILWRYYATNDVAKKIEHLFHYFEAFSEFISMVTISSLAQNEEFYHAECSNWMDSESKFKDWIYRASFGGWNMLFARLSKFLRKKLQDNANKNQLIQILGSPSQSYIEMLINKEIVNILNSVSELRNKHKGHGGISSVDESKRLITILTEYLTNMRSAIAGGFDCTKIISPGRGEFEGGMYTFNIKELVGAKSPFNEVEIESKIALDKNKLYLYHVYQNKPIELLPFIKYVDSSNAVYFYSSVQGSNVRWVSYHFEGSPELTQPINDEISRTLELLNEKNSLE